MTAARPRLHVGASRCVGSGQCVLVAPDVFAQSQTDGTVRLLTREPPPGRMPIVNEAVERCPVQALLLDEEWMT